MHRPYLGLLTWVRGGGGWVTFEKKIPVSHSEKNQPVTTTPGGGLVTQWPMGKRVQIFYRVPLAPAQYVPQPGEGVGSSGPKPVSHF